MNLRSVARKVVLVFSLLVCAFFGNVLLYQSSTGYFVSVGCGDSMEPNYDGGDLLLSTGEYNSIQEGDVVRYIDKEGNSVYHRVVHVDETRENPYLIKGDNNQRSDGWYSEDDIESKLLGQIVNVEELC